MGLQVWQIADCMFHICADTATAQAGLEVWYITFTT